MSQFIREELVSIARRCYQERLMAGTSGNLSALDPATGHLLITPSSLDYMIMQPADIVEMKLTGEIITGSVQRRPSSEWRMHAEIYRNRPDITAVVHTHSIYATACAVAHEPIPLILIEMIPYLGGDIPVIPFAMPGTAELGSSALGVLSKRNGCLLANHGTLAVGTSLQEAYIHAVYIEETAQIYQLAKAAGSIHTIPQQAAIEMARKYQRKL